MKVRRGIAFVLSLAFGACGVSHEASTVPRDRGGRGGRGGREAVDASARDAGPESDGEPTSLCDLSPSIRGSIEPTKRAFTRDTPRCPEKDPMCDVADAPADPTDTCFVATKNLARAERAAANAPRGPVLASQPWNGTSTPRYLDRIDSVYRLSTDEHALLRSNGFVVLDRVAYDSYAHGFHGVFQTQMPVYVGVDAIFQAIYRSNESILSSIERERLGPALVRLLDKMLRAVRANERVYGPELTHDLRVYLGVPRAMLPGGEALWQSEQRDVLALRDAVSSVDASGLLTLDDLFGRPRVVDVGQFRPRGHYAELGPPIVVDKEHSFATEDYFRAVSWLSRIELNLVSRDGKSSHPGPSCDRSEAPREVRLALALAEIARSSGAQTELAEFDRVYTIFAGDRQDVSPDMLLRLANGTSARAPNAVAALSASIGSGQRRSARTEFTLECVKDLPVVFTMFGPRLAPDTAPLTQLVHNDVADRYHLGAADVAYVLGHDRAKAYLERDLAAFPSLTGKLAQGRSAVVESDRAVKPKNLYGLWLRAITRLADSPKGVVPSFTTKDAFKDYRMNAAIAAFAGLRKSFVLMVAQGYDTYGCEIPDGYVEPAIGTYEALLDYVAAARTIDPTRRQYYDRVQKVLGMLVAISKRELAGQPLSEPQKRWLGMVAEYIPSGGYADSGMPPTYTGWYFDLFPDREKGAFTRPDLVADYFTLTNEGTAAHVGVEGARLGVFVVDVGGEPRAMLGPVAKAYEAHVPLSEGRLDDARARTWKHERAPWLGYVAKAPPPLPVDVSYALCDSRYVVTVDTKVPLGAVSLLLSDHHGDSLGAPTRATIDSPGRTVFGFDWGDGTRGRGPVEGWDLAIRTSGTAEIRHVISVPNAATNLSFDSPEGP